MTRTEAAISNEFHLNGSCKRTIGPRGGEKVTKEVWRKVGGNHTWKRDPERFEFSIKFGFRGPYNTITQANLEHWHTPQNCPLNRAGEVK